MEKLITIEVCLKNIQDAMSFGMLYDWLMNCDDIYAFKEDDDNRWRLDILINELREYYIDTILKEFSGIIIKKIS
jgi:hypothetical protein